MNVLTFEYAGHKTYYNICFYPYAGGRVREKQSRSCLVEILVVFVRHAPKPHDDNAGNAGYCRLKLCPLGTRPRKKSKVCIVVLIFMEGQLRHKYSRI